MVRIIFSSSFYWYYKHGSRMFIAHIKKTQFQNTVCIDTSKYRV